MKREPNFANLQKVLRRERPDRPTLFEFFLNGPLYERLAGPAATAERKSGPLGEVKFMIAAFGAAGYDYATINAAALAGFGFKAREKHHKSSISLNEAPTITSRAEFEQYPWPDMAKFDYSFLGAAQAHLPAGMKLIVCGPSGVLENVIRLVGYDNLCFMIADEPELAEAVFTAVGSRLLAYYQACLPYASVGAIITNDDWGFKTQTMLAPADMRRYVFPWHKRMAQAAHAAGKPVILHSCGFFGEIVEDMFSDIGYDGRHSYEDAILPVEEAYEKYHDRVAILGGLDLDFICRSTPAEIRRRAEAMLERSATRGGYGLGSGNSIPEYVPQENYFAMISAAVREPAMV